MAEQPVFVRGRMTPEGVERMRRFFVWLYGLFADIDVRGLEHVPPGGLIMTPNHLSRFDPPLVFMALPQRKVTVFNASTYRRNPIFRWVLQSVDCVWVDRGATSPATIKAALQALKDGSVLGVAPEGTRSRTHALQEGKTGAAYLALASGVPIVPVGLTNVDKLGAAIRRLQRIRLTVAFGPAFRLGAPDGTRRGRTDPKRLQEATDEIMCRIAALLPQDYRGVYADHPRLQELLRAPGVEVAAGTV